MTQTFFQWLNSRWPRQFSDLRTYANTNAIEWREVRTFQDAWLQLDADPKVDASRKQVLFRELSRAFDRFNGTDSSVRRFMGLNGFGIGVFLFMSFVLVILGIALFEPLLLAKLALAAGKDPTHEPLLNRLSDVETARGLITFVFTTGVIALALIIVTANVTDQEGQDGRFALSKEILTSLVAILATILGFYYGKVDSEPEAEEMPVIQPVTQNETIQDPTQNPTNGTNTDPNTNQNGGDG